MQHSMGSDLDQTQGRSNITADWQETLQNQLRRRGTGVGTVRLQRWTRHVQVRKPGPNYVWTDGADQNGVPTRTSLRSHCQRGPTLSYLSARGWSSLSFNRGRQRVRVRGVTCRHPGGRSTLFNLRAGVEAFEH